MSDPVEAGGGAAPQDPQEHLAAMFASMVIQQTNMATIFLGLAPNPQTGQTTQDLEHAQFFIDQLEMLEAKTKGNLSKPEEGLLKQSLTHLRMAFVEAVSKPQAPPPSEGRVDAPAAASGETPPVATPGEAAAMDDSKKKFTKKY